MNLISMLGAHTGYHIRSPTVCFLQATDCMWHNYGLIRCLWLRVTRKTLAALLDPPLWRCVCDRHNEAKTRWKVAHSDAMRAKGLRAKAIKAAFRTRNSSYNEFARWTQRRRFSPAMFTFKNGLPCLNRNIFDRRKNFSAKIGRPT